MPGVIYDSYSDLKNQEGDTHFFRFDGTLFNFDEPIYHPTLIHHSKEEIEDKIQAIHDIAKQSSVAMRKPEKGGFELVNGSEINPYAVGHLINHTPLDHRTNVCLVDVFIQKKLVIVITIAFFLKD